MKNIYFAHVAKMIKTFDSSFIEKDGLRYNTYTTDRRIKKKSIRI